MIGIARKTAWLGAALAVAAAMTASSRATATLTLAIAGRSNANVSMASDRDFVVAVWSASMASGHTDIYLAVSRNAAATFSTPVRVNSTPGDARVNGEQPPRVAFAASNGTERAIVVVWTAKEEKGTSLRMARSEDGGRTFGVAVPVPGSQAAGNRGWEAIASDSAGVVSAVWLDHRRLARQEDAATTHHHQAGMSAGAAAMPDSMATAELSQLYFGSLDGSVQARPLTGGVCYCCKTALVAGPGRSLYAAWRHVYPGNLRDMAFAMSKDGGRTFTSPIRVSEDKWQLEGCPDDGPAMTRAHDASLHIVWPTLVNDSAGAPTIGLFHAMSRDGQQFSDRVKLPSEGLPHHPQIASLSNGALAVTWDEFIEGKRRIVLARGVPDTSGRTLFRRQILSSGEPGIYPVVAATSNGLVAAWTSGAPQASVIRLVRQ